MRSKNVRRWIRGSGLSLNVKDEGSRSYASMLLCMQQSSSLSMECGLMLARHTRNPRKWTTLITNTIFRAANQRHGSITMHRTDPLRWVDILAVDQGRIACKMRRTWSQQHVVQDSSLGLSACAVAHDLSSRPPLLWHGPIYLEDFIRPCTHANFVVQPWLAGQIIQVAIAPALIRKRPRDTGSQTAYWIATSPYDLGRKDYGPSPSPPATKFRIRLTARHPQPASDPTSRPWVCLLDSCG